MNPTDRLKQMQTEKKRIASREEMIVDIHERYARFGEHVVLIVLQYMSRSTGLRELVERLPMHALGFTDKQMHETIVRFILNEGVSRFLEFSESATSPKADGIPTVLQPLAKPAAADAPIPGAAAQAPPPTAGQDPNLVWVDRRQRSERRKRVDRRLEVDVISQNKRFGGERRKGKDRRKKQTPPPWPK